MAESVEVPGQSAAELRHDVGEKAALSDLILADLVEDGVLTLVVENHRFEFVTGQVYARAGFGVRAGRRCTKCKQWAMGDHPGDSADEVCPDVRYHYISGWRNGTGPPSAARGD